jgi:hypothetical protein
MTVHSSHPARPSNPNPVSRFVGLMSPRVAKMGIALAAKEVQVRGVHDEIGNGGRSSVNHRLPRRTISAGKESSRASINSITHTPLCGSSSRASLGASDAPTWTRRRVVRERERDAHTKIALWHAPTVPLVEKNLTSQVCYRSKPEA